MEGTMKQLVLTAKGGPWELREVPIPKPGPGQILLKVLAASVCNQTDLNAIKALHPPHLLQSANMLPHHLRMWDDRLKDDPLAKYYNVAPHQLEPYPTTMGHEGMGEIVEIGPRVENRRSLQVGDRVGLGGVESAFAQYVITTEDAVAKVPDNLTNEEASLTEPCTILWGMCRALVRHDDVVCILGQGALGLFATQWSRVFGAKTIITTDPIKMKRDLSKRFGADYVIDPTSQNVTAEIDRLTNGVGCDVVIECAGEPDSISNIPYIAAFDGRVGQIGACCEPVLVDWSYIHFKGLKVFSGTAAMELIQLSRRETLFNKVIQAASMEKESGRLHLSEMITHRIGLTVEDITALFKEIDEKGTVVKAIIDPWKE